MAKPVAPVANDDGFHFFIRWLEADLAALGEKSLQRHVALVKLSNATFSPSFSGCLMLDDNDVPVVDVLVDHALPHDLQERKYFLFHAASGSAEWR